MAAAQDDPAADVERFMVTPRSPGTAGIEALARLGERVRAIPGGRADQPRPVPGLARTTPRLLVTLPRGSATALQAEFGSQLVFEVDAPLRY